MHECLPRSLAAVDADLRALSAATRHARGELAEVRRRQRELADLEAELVVAIELHFRRIDEVLDERSGTVPADGEAAPQLRPAVEHPLVPSMGLVR